MMKEIALALVSLCLMSTWSPLKTDSSENSSPGGICADCESVLLDILESADDHLQAATVAAAGLTESGYGDKVKRILSDKLGQVTLVDQCAVAAELIRAGDFSRTGILLNLAKDGTVDVKSEAFQKLYELNTIGDGTILRELMTTGSDSDKAYAASILAQQGNLNAATAQRSYLNHTEDLIAAWTAFTMAKSGQSMDMTQLSQRSRSVRNDQASAWMQAARYLKGESAAADALMASAEASSPGRKEAIRLLGLLQVKKSADLLQGLLDDPSPVIRAESARALLQLHREVEHADQDIITDFFQAGDAHPRYTEASVAPLLDGSLLYSISEFNSGPGDHATAQIVAARSTDGGRTWEDKKVIQPNVGKLNVMSSSLIRTGDVYNGETTLGHFYLVKNSLKDLQIHLRNSHDEAITFDAPIRITSEPGYHVMNNDRVQRLKSGRLILPVASTSDVGSVNHFISHSIYSDDGGMTWSQSENRVDYHRRGAMEPEIIEFKDGRLGMIFRTQLGHIGISYSSDEGETWTEGESWGVVAPESPSTCRRIPSTGDLLLIWNDNYEPGAGHQGKRIPLTAAISDDEGKTWKHKRNLEVGPNRTAAYASLTFHEGRALLTYTVRDEVTKLRSHRFRSLPISWFYQE